MIDMTPFTEALLLIGDEFHARQEERVEAVRGLIRVALADKPELSAALERVYAACPELSASKFQEQLEAVRGLVLEYRLTSEYSPAIINLERVWPEAVNWDKE